MRTRRTTSLSDTAAPVPADVGFAEFRLDVRGGVLLRGGERIPLRAKTWGVLRYLADRPGVLISKDELLDALWPDVAVTPDTLSKSIGELRSALGDASQSPRFIETVHRRGFRFIAETRPLDAASRAAGTAIVAEASLAERSGTSRAFVGREAELTALTAAFERAGAGERQLVFITGGAGGGKSALIDAFVGRIAGRHHGGPVWIAHAGCFEHHGPLEPYLPVLDSLERLARLPDAQPLLELMRRVAPMWLVQFPGMVTDADAEQIRRSLVGVGIERMARELAALFEALTAELTIVLILEDLHWSDPSTVDLLTLLARRPVPARLLVIGTYRPAELAVREHALAAAVRSLREQRQCLELPLGDLAGVDVRAYLAARFPDNRFPPALAGLLHGHTGGHPLFLVGIVDHLRSRGWILDTEPGWGLSAPLESLDLGVPDDVRRMIETQLARLGPPERALLEAASVAAPQIAAPIVAAALDCEIGAAESLCERLAASGSFLRVAGAVEWPTGEVARRYAFTHDLRQKVVYDEIPEGRLARLHRRVGEALETAHGARAGEIAAQLTVHFQRGRTPAKALRYMIAAGSRARRFGASREALGWLQPGLALVELLPEGDERRRLELDLRLALGRALGDIHGFAAEAVRESYEHATRLCAALGAEAERCEVLSARWYLHALRAERDQTLALAAEVGALAERLADPGARVLAGSILVRTAVYDGRFADARAHMRALTVHAPEATGGGAYGADPIIAAVMHDAMAQWFLGDAAGAVAAAGAGVARAEAHADPFSLCATLHNASVIHLWAGRDADADTFSRRALAMAAEHGFAFWSMMAGSVSGLAAVRAGRAAEGLEALRGALAALQERRTRFFAAFIRAFLAEACLRTGATAEGIAHTEAGIELCRTTLDRSFHPELWRLRGELLRAAPRPRRGGQRAADTATAQAERCLQHALELARAAGAPALELRAAVSLARAWRDAGRGADARALLARSCAPFASATDHLDLDEARALLATLSAAS